MQFSGTAVANLSTEALRKLKKDGRCKPGGKKTLRAMKLMIS
jgi:hypothetical protein